jgi:membrane protein DedA with SNARE-associated domain
MIAAISGVVISLISSGGYWSVILLMALESACLPLPSEIIMPFAGYLASTGRLNLLWVATAGAVGCNFGSPIAWLIGHYGGRPLAERWGRILFIDREELERMSRLFVRYGAITIFVSRLLPGVRTYIALPAGIAHMRQLPFQIYTFLGSWPWCFVLAYIGVRLGREWNSDPRLRQVFQASEGVVLLLVAVAIVAYIAYRRAAFRRRQEERLRRP